MSQAPLIYRNWQAFRNGEPEVGASEYPFYTDAEIVGEARDELGPYELINTIAGDKSERPSIVLRLSNHIEHFYDDPAYEGDEHYHGGYRSDAMAALLALVIGARVKSGMMSRSFELEKDPKGRPVAYAMSGRSEPVVPPVGDRPMLPAVLGKKKIGERGLIKTYPELDQADATALLRAARLYQDGAWIAESEPELTWLMLVAAVESVASHWWRGEEAARETLERSRPDLLGILIERGDDELVEKVAQNMAPRMRATKKFIDFLLEFAPGPPPVRCHEYRRLDWSKSSLKTVFNKVYERRSIALHAGKPFPAPMCRPTERAGDNYAEVPMISGAYGATWGAEEAPLLLHTFEYIARNAILAWWEELTQ